MLAYFIRVTLSANQNAYSYRISGGGGISILYNKIYLFLNIILKKFLKNLQLEMYFP